MAKYTVRAPFAIHLQWVEKTKDANGTERKTLREQSYFNGPTPIELTDADALKHMHKLEPADDAAKKLFGDYHDKQDEAIAARQAQDGNTKSLAAQVAEAVVGALIAAGVIKPKASA
jgi:hypothetical protein